MKTEASIVFLLLCTPVICTASSVDKMFEAQDNQSATSTAVDSGVHRSAHDSENSVVQRANAISRAKEERYREISERASAERAAGNGNRYYLCEFSCTTSGLLFAEGTGKMKTMVKADEPWQASDRAESEAKKLCGSIRGSDGLHKGETMYFTGMHCDEKR